MKLKKAPALTVTHISWEHKTRHDQSIANGVMIASGDDILFFRDEGYAPGRRYYNLLTGCSRWADFDYFMYKDWRPVHPSCITEQTIESVGKVRQGLDALDFIEDMVGGCPAIIALVAPILKRYGALDHFCC